MRASLRDASASKKGKNWQFCHRRVKHLFRLNQTWADHLICNLQCSLVLLRCQLSLTPVSLAKVLVSLSYHKISLHCRQGLQVLLHIWRQIFGGQTLQDHLPPCQLFQGQAWKGHAWDCVTWIQTPHSFIKKARLLLKDWDPRGQKKRRKYGRGQVERSNFRKVR